ncbi:MAG TPA: thioesterase family protein [Gaiellaceae bacterium]|nr:thioesterase family protein [Gaiellaceae bacterium]
MELGRPTDRKPPFKFSALTRVGFSDTDAQGIVYYGRYLPYFDQARVEYERHLGLLRGEAAGKDFVMRASEVVYDAPARFDDLLEVFVRTRRIGVTSVGYEFCAYRVEDDQRMCTAEQTMVLVASPDRRPTPISDEYRRVVAGFEGADLELPAPAA